MTALDLTDGPVHAEMRVNGQGTWILEAAARPIGGRCARVLRFDAPFLYTGTPPAQPSAWLRRFERKAGAGKSRCDDDPPSLSQDVYRGGKVRKLPASSLE